MINFKASKWMDMTDWTTTDLYEPPLTQHLTEENLKKLIKEEYKGSGTVFHATHRWLSGREGSDKGQYCLCWMEKSGHDDQSHAHASHQIQETGDKQGLCELVFNS